MDNEHYMQIALALAAEAARDGEIPIGCVIVSGQSEVIGKGRNMREKDKCATAHAEIRAIADACKTIGDWRLAGCSLYVTLEPCPMCAGAAIMSRIDNVFYGAKESRTGSCGSIINLFMEPYGSKTRVVGGILEKECSALLSEFFKNRRK